MTMKTGKRLLALALMLLMLLSVLPTGALAAYAPFSTSYSYESVTLNGYTEEQLAAFPVSTFLSLLGSEYADAQKIAWTREYGSDNYTVADAATGTIDLRFLGSHYFDLYTIVGSGNMLDFAGNTQLRVYVKEGYDHLLSSYSLQWRGDGAEWTVCENQSFSSSQYQEMYWVNFFPEPVCKTFFLTRAARYEHSVAIDVRGQFRGRSLKNDLYIVHDYTEIFL